jgi:hypothetical protein
VDVGACYQRGKCWWVRLHEKGGKDHEVPCHHKLEQYLDASLAAAGLAGRKGEPLFPSLDRRCPRGRRLTGRRLTRHDMLEVVKRRATPATR